MSKIKEYYHDEIEKQMREFSDEDFAYEKYMKEKESETPVETDCDCKENCKNKQINK